MTNFRTEPSWQRDPGSTSNIVLDPLATIYNEGQWRLYKVSPLYKVQYETLRLKQYGSKIRQTIVSSVTTNSSLKYAVTVDPEPHLKFSEHDPHGLQITVACSSQELTSKTKLSYTAILLCWGMNTNLKGVPATHLPYLLERGEQKIGAAVRSSLQSLFDCNIKQFCFTQLQLLQIGFNILEYDTSKETKPFVLVYNSPQLDVKNKLTFSFEIGDMRIIWNGVKEEVETPAERIHLAYQFLQKQIFHMVTLNITGFELTEILLPNGEVKCSGVVKMKNAEMVNCVFKLLNEICAACYYIKDIDDIVDDDEDQCNK